MLEERTRFAGLISGTTYFFCYLVALVSSYLEMQAINHLKHKQTQGKETAAAEQ